MNLKKQTKFGPLLKISALFVQQFVLFTPAAYDTSAVSWDADEGGLYKQGFSKSQPHMLPPVSHVLYVKTSIDCQRPSLTKDCGSLSAFMHTCRHIYPLTGEHAYSK